MSVSTTFFYKNTYANFIFNWKKLAASCNLPQVALESYFSISKTEAVEKTCGKLKLAASCARIVLFN